MLLQEAKELHVLSHRKLAEVGAELLFQVVSERCERAATVTSTNLPFSE